MHAFPDEMIAIDPAMPGGPEVLAPVKRPVPRPGAGEVLIKVAAAGVNRPDILQRKGHYPPPPGAPTILGLEVAGTVAAVGEGVASPRAGDPVCALLSGGGYAGYVAVPAGQVLRVPQGLSMVEAASLPETVFTVWVNVFERGYARDGEVLLVHGGTSGIGITAIQLAKAFGLKVLVTCGSDDKCAAARNLGADVAINYRSEDFVERARAETGGRGVDVVLDMVGGDYIQRDLDCLAEDGRVALIAVQGGTHARIDLARLMVRRLSLTGSTLRARPAVFKAMVAEELLANVWPLIDVGVVRPVIDSVFALDQAAAAHARLETGAHVGKVVLTVEG